MSDEEGWYVSQIVDMAEVTEKIRSYDDPVGKGVAHVTGDEDLPHVLTELVYVMHNRGVDPCKCAYYMHPSVRTDLLDHETMTHAHTLGGFKGRPIYTDGGIPDDVVLFMAPDAVGMGGKVYNPLAIGYADLHDQ